MAIEDRRQRESAARRQLIVNTARSLAERDGWDAVTTRRLSTEIEYSQPVIYKHFASMEDLMQAVALDGFDELANALALARRDATPDAVLSAVAGAYTDFADANPALYDVMFRRSTRLHFGVDAVAPLHDAFVELRAAVAESAASSDLDTLTEVIWAALHGLTTLARNGRLRPDHDAERLHVLVASLRPAGSEPTRPARRGG